ncbi:cyclic-phosphate processing receiver domain-containing protein [Tundrisphaera sp. TA3]|uniref:cyclic-phosphate processing receiver domain-containing protein n=1 Tax=Tundrisphaera sp. TA3 TaxID=3435775 RepID=UPI003EB94996
MATHLRRLFLDDDPARADVFLGLYPDAVWVETVPECVEKLAESWDEVHLDHDLGGEVYVDDGREDCGMEVIRWLDRDPPEHLRSARFIVHSHNQHAAFVMVLRLKAMGYRAEARPFGIDPPGSEAPTARPWDRARDLLRRIRGLPPLDDPAPEPDPDSPDWIP